MAINGLRVYIAAPFELREAAVDLRAGLAAFGIGCTARWIDNPDNTYTTDWAQRCLDDVVRCDILLALNPQEFARSGTGGRHAEFGAALILKKPTLVIGARTNIFHELSAVTAQRHPIAFVAELLALATIHGLGGDPPADPT